MHLTVVGFSMQAFFLHAWVSTYCVLDHSGAFTLLPDLPVVCLNIVGSLMGFVCALASGHQNTYCYSHVIKHLQNRFLLGSFCLKQCCACQPLTNHYGNLARFNCDSSHYQSHLHCNRHETTASS
jgi:hypothetical protein